MKNSNMQKRILAFLLALVMVAGSLHYFDKQVEAESPDATFGVISDTHLTKADSDWKRQETLKRALTYYKEQGVSLIAVNADIVDLGEDAAYAKFNTIWDEVFTDSATAPKLLVTADNHEYYAGWNMSGHAATETVTASKARFKTAFESKAVFASDSIHSVVEDSGYYFIGVSSDAVTNSSDYQTAGTAYYSEATLTWLETQLETAKAADATKPIYLFIHQPADGTVPGGEDIPKTMRDLLEKYPQIVLFTSHTHLPLEDECQIYQKDYTVVNTSAIYERQQGLLVTAAGTSTEIQRCDFSGNTVKQIKNNWTIPTPADTATYTYTVEKRNAAAAAPTFATGAAVTSIPYANNRIKVMFPAAVASENWPSDFVYEYEVTVKDSEGTVVSTDKSWADFVNNTADRDVTKNVTRVMRLDSDMTNGAVYSIEVKAYDSLGNASTAITGSYTHETIDIDTILEPKLRTGATNNEKQFYFNVNASDDNLAADSSWYLRIQPVSGKGGIYRNGETLNACIAKTSINSDGTNTYMLFLSGGGKTNYTAETGDVITLAGMFEVYNFGGWLDKEGNAEYADHSVELKTAHFIYHGAEKGWEQLDSLDDYFTANEISLTDATVKMGGDYGDGAYYDLKASFSGDNWILNETKATETNITLEYTVNSEERGAGGLYGMLRAEKTNNSFPSNNGLLHFIANGAADTYYTKQGKNVTLMYDYENHTFSPFRGTGTTYIYTGSAYANYKAPEAFDTQFTPGYFGLGFTAGTYDIDFTKVLMYDGDNNALGLQRYNSSTCTSWDLKLMADYGATIYVEPTKKVGYVASDIKLLDVNGQEVQGVQAAQLNNGVWSFTMEDEIVEVKAIYVAATANELTVKDAVVKMGGDYGDGAYYNLKASFNGYNWLVNETAAPRTDITFKYTVNSEKRESGGMYGVFRTENIASCKNYNFGIINYPTQGTDTYTSLNGNPTTVMYDYSEHKPVPFQNRTYKYTATSGTQYASVSGDANVINAYTAFDSASNPGYFGIGWYGGTYEIDFTKVMMYDGNNNALGIHSNSTNRTAWDLRLMADYGSTIYVTPTEKDGYIAVGLKLMDVNGAEVQNVEVTNNDGVWSFVMTKDIVSVEPVYESAATLKATSVTLDGSIGANFYMSLPEDIVEAISDVSMKFTLNGTTQVVKDYVYNEENSAYVFSYYIPAKHMSDTIYAQLFVGETARSDKYQFTVKEYANTILADSQYSDAIKTLVENMLHYGAASQTYFKYNTNNLANEGLESLSLTDVTQSTFTDYVAGSVIEANGFGNIVASNLQLKSQTTLTVYIQLEEGINIEDYTFKCGDNTLEKGLHNNKWITVKIPNIAANHLDTIYEIVATNGTDNYTFKYSVFTYAYKTLDESYNPTTSIKDLVKVMYKYNVAANAVSSN